MHMTSEEDSLVLDTGLFQELHESLGNELEIVAGIYGRFVGNAAGSIEVSRRQTGAERAATLHALKGSASMIGAPRLAALAGELQDSLLNASANDAENALAEVASELAAFQAALQNHLDSLGYRPPS
jgi:HPt (histidine-containing phosphotransfer) domain-containing protein